MKKLHTSIFADRFNTYSGKYSFRLIHRPEEERIYIGVFSLDCNVELDCSVYYTYQDIEIALTDKLHDLLYVSAQRKYDEDGSELFLFDSAEIYTSPSLYKFLELLDKGEIMYDIRMGAFSSGKNYGKPHDHGSGFRIRQENIMDLYSFRQKLM